MFSWATVPGIWGKIEAFYTPDWWLLAEFAFCWLGTKEHKLSAKSKLSGVFFLRLALFFLILPAYNKNKQIVKYWEQKLSWPLLINTLEISKSIKSSKIDLNCIFSGDARLTKYWSLAPPLKCIFMHVTVSILIHINKALKKERVVIFVI